MSKIPGIAETSYQNFVEITRNSEKKHFGRKKHFSIQNGRCIIYLSNGIGPPS
jgi:hypothetical protein